MGVKPSRREIQRVKKAIQQSLPPLPDDSVAKEEELRKRSSFRYRGFVKAGKPVPKE